MKMSILTLLMSLFSSVAFSLVFDLPKEGDDVVGERSEITLDEPMTLEQVGRENELGPREMQAANPGLSKTNKLAVGTTVVLPLQFILPKERSGIVINVAEFRLYFFPEDSNTVETFPVAIAAVRRHIPLGTTRVEQKLVDPIWYPPASVRRDKPSLPWRVMPGPQNPLGPRALRLGMPDILIHGTNKPESIGTRASYGCFRMFKSDIGSFWDRVPAGMTVSLVDRPVSFGTLDQQLYVRMMPSLEGKEPGAQFDAAILELQRTNEEVDFSVDLKTLKGSKRDGSVLKVGQVDRPLAPEGSLKQEQVSVWQTAQEWPPNKEFQTD